MQLSFVYDIGRLPSLNSYLNAPITTSPYLDTRTYLLSSWLEKNSPVPHFHGTKVEIDFLRDRVLYNDSEALCTLGALHYLGHGAELNEVLAKRYFHQAAQQEYALALYNIALVLLMEAQHKYGRSVFLHLKEKCEQIIEFFEQAAKYNDVGANYFLGICYHYGFSFEQNIPLAIQYYTKARSHNYAKIQLSKIYEFLLETEYKASYEDILLELYQEIKDAFYEQDANIYEEYFNKAQNFRQEIKNDNEKSFYSHSFENFKQELEEDALYRCASNIYPPVYSKKKKTVISKKYTFNNKDFLRRSALSKKKKENSRPVYKSSRLATNLFAKQEGGTRSSLNRPSLESMTRGNVFRSKQKSSQNKPAVIKDSLSNAKLFLHCHNTSSLAYPPPQRQAKANTTVSYAAIIPVRKKRAQLGDPDEQFYLGLMYFLGQGLPRRLDLTYKWWIAAAKQGHLTSMFNVSTLLKYGDGIDVDMEQALYWYKKCHELEFYDASVEIAQIYLNPNLAPLGLYQPEKALFYLNQAAEKNHVESAFFAATLYDDGGLIEENKEKALELYTKAANLGHVNAQMSLGILYSQGVDIEENEERALEYFHMAAETGNALALYNLFVLQYNQDRTLSPQELPARYLIEAAEKGLVDAQLRLAGLYNAKALAESEESNERIWLEEACAQGDARAFFALGVFYNQNNNEDIETVIELWEESAKRGYAPAQYNVGRFYEEGVVFSKDNKKAIKWYKKAYNQGDIEAAYRLGLLYSLGDGVEKNIDKALEYYNFAVEKGHEEAEIARGKLYEVYPQMQPEYFNDLDYLRRKALQNKRDAQVQLGLNAYKKLYHKKEYHQEKQLSNEALIWFALASVHSDVEERTSTAPFMLGKLLLQNDDSISEKTGAKLWYIASTEYQYNEAMYNLAMLYGSGIGLEKNSSLSLYWIKKAFENGSLEAKDFVQKHDLYTILANIQEDEQENFEKESYRHFAENSEANSSLSLSNPSSVPSTSITAMPIEFSLKELNFLPCYKLLITMQKALLNDISALKEIALAYQKGEEIGPSQDIARRLLTLVED